MYVDPTTVETVPELPAGTDAPRAVPATRTRVPALHTLRGRPAWVPADPRDLDEIIPRDGDARRGVALGLLGRGWSSAAAAAASGLPVAEVTALATVVDGRGARHADAQPA